MRTDVKNYNFSLIYPTEQVKIFAFATALLNPKSIAMEVIARDQDGREVEPRLGAYYSTSLDAYYTYLAPAEAEFQERYIYAIHYPSPICSLRITLRPWEMDKELSVDNVIKGLAVSECSNDKSGPYIGNYIALAEK